jgi:hypothetical protein
MALQHHTKTNTALFHAEWPFKLVHAASLSSGGTTIALCGNIKFRTIKHNSTLNISMELQILNTTALTWQGPG